MSQIIPYICSLWCLGLAVFNGVYAVKHLDPRPGVHMILAAVAVFASVVIFLVARQGARIRRDHEELLRRWKS